MIKPTIGRIVLFRPNDPDYDESYRNAAIVANVNDDGTVHLGVFNHYGVCESEQSVTLVQDDNVPELGQCEWMPYQKGQAAKYDVTTDDLMACIARLEELLTSDQVGLELPPLALKAPAEIPDNVTEITKGDDVDPVDHSKPQPGDADYQDNTLAEKQAAGTDDEEKTVSDGNVSGPDGTDESTDDITEGDAAAGEQAATEEKPAEELQQDAIESAALMGLKAHAAEVELEGVSFMDAEGEPCDATTDKCVEVEYTFVDGVSYVLTKAESEEQLMGFEFMLKEVAAES